MFCTSILHADTSLEFVPSTTRTPAPTTPHYVSHESTRRFDCLSDGVGDTATTRNIDHDHGIGTAIIPKNSFSTLYTTASIY